MYCVNNRDRGQLQRVFMTIYVVNKRDCGEFDHNENQGPFIRSIIEKADSYGDII